MAYLQPLLRLIVSSYISEMWLVIWRTYHVVAYRIRRRIGLVCQTIRHCGVARRRLAAQWPATWLANGRNADVAGWLI
jgi:hypothetical protein